MIISTSVDKAKVGALKRMPMKFDISKRYMARRVNEDAIGVAGYNVFYDVDNLMANVVMEISGDGQLKYQCYIGVVGKTGIIEEVMSNVTCFMHLLDSAFDEAVDKRHKELPRCKYRVLETGANGITIHVHDEPRHFPMLESNICRRCGIDLSEWV